MSEHMTATQGIVDGTPGAGPELTPMPKPPATGGAPVPNQESSAFLSRLVQETGSESGEISSNTTADNVLSEASGVPVEDFPPSVEPSSLDPNSISTPEPGEPVLEPATLEAGVAPNPEPGTSPATEALAEPATEPEATPKVKSFKTAKGSVYTYDADGKTTRFKTATGEQQPRQDITVFADLNETEEADMLQAVHSKGKKAVYVFERKPDNTQDILSDISQVTNPDEVYLGIVENGQLIFSKKASTQPVAGSVTLDARKLQDKNGEWMIEPHLGHKVTEIEYEKPDTTEAADPEAAPATGPEVDPGEDTADGEGEATKPPTAAKPEADGPLLTFEAGVQKERNAAEIKLGRELNAQEEELFETRRLQAVGKDSSLKRAAAEKALGGTVGRLASRLRVLARRGTTDQDRTAVEARKAQKESYEELFESARKQAKVSSEDSFLDRLKGRFNGAYFNKLTEMTKDAQASRDNLKASYESTQKDGTPQEIEDAKMRYEAAKMHHSTINNEKRKKAFWNAIGKVLLLIGASAIMESGKTVTNSATEAVSQPRR